MRRAIGVALLVLVMPACGEDARAPDSSAETAATSEPSKPPPDYVDDPGQGRKFADCDAAILSAGEFDAASVSSGSRGRVREMTVKGLRAFHVVTANKKCFPEDLYLLAKKYIDDKQYSEFPPEFADLAADCQAIAWDSLVLLSYAAGRKASGDNEAAIELAKGFDALAAKDANDCYSPSNAEKARKRLRSFSGGDPGDV